MSDYRCKWCGKTIERDSDKAWIRSLCKTTGKTVHMMRCSPVTAPWTEAERDAAAQAIERHFYDGSSTEDYYDDDSGDEDRAIAAAVLDVVAPMIARRAVEEAYEANWVRMGGDPDD